MAKSSLAIRVLLISGIAVGALAMVGLGFWQLARLAERRTFNAEVRARLAQPPLLLTGQPLTGTAQLEYRPVIARGEYDFANEIVLRNRAHVGQPGVHVLTPLKLTGSDVAVLVDRGWIPYTQAAPEARAHYQTPAGEVKVEGSLRRSSPTTGSASFLPADPTFGPGTERLDAWFWVNLSQIQQQLPYPLLPMYVMAAPRAGETQLPIRDDDLDLSEGSHLGYAIQWFSFAAILVFGPLLYRYQQQQKIKRPPD